MPKTTKQLVDEANQAYAAFKEAKDACDRATTEEETVRRKMAELITGKTEGTLGELQTLYAQTETRRANKQALSSKSAKARVAAFASYTTACKSLAKDAGLTDSLEPKCVLCYDHIKEDVQMTGQLHQDGSENPG